MEKKPEIDPELIKIFGEPISVYTSDEAVNDGILFDLDELIKNNKIKTVGPIDAFPIKYITTNLLSNGYYQDRCNNAVQIADAGTNERCRTCPTWIVFANSGNKTLPCKEKTLSIPNMLDLINQALRIFAKKAVDDYFVSGLIELPTGKKQIIFIEQNETGRYTVMLPEDR